MLYQEYVIEMCYINIYVVTRYQVSLLIKAKVFDFFSLICMEKKAETFFSVNVKRAKIQTMARKHTHSDQVQKVVGLITDEPRPPYFFCNKIAQSARVSQDIQKNLFHRTEDDSSNT